MNLYNAYVAIYGVPTGSRNVEFTVAGNIGSSSTATAALDTGTWPAGSTIKLIVPAVSDGSNSPANGVIAGAGGNGGGSRQSGFSGGNAMNLNYNLTINNNGIIGGGGGGGGVGTDIVIGNIRYAGGGGGAGISIGAGGSGNASGVAGTYLNGGAGGNYSSGRALGGAGGSLGNGGGTGFRSDGTFVGGAAGKCINLNGYAVSTLGTGSYLGVIS